MKKQSISLKIANVTLRVPVYRDEETTHAIAEKVTERFQAIEEASDRVDTQVFALRTAFDMAVELFALMEEQEADTRELLIMLDTISSRLEEILKSAEDEG
jgi:cell division protein ZapA (FtsZ GTPase activity inhibitor)